MSKPEQGKTPGEAAKRLAKKALSDLPQIKDAVRFFDAISREIERREGQQSGPLIDRFNDEVDDALDLLKIQHNAPPTIGWTVLTSPKTQRKYLVTRESNGRFQLHSALQVGQLDIDPDDIETIAEFNQETYSAIRALHIKAFPEES